VPCLFPVSCFLLTDVNPKELNSLLQRTILLFQTLSNLPSERYSRRAGPPSPRAQSTRHGHRYNTITATCCTLEPLTEMFDAVGHQNLTVWCSWVFLYALVSVQTMASRSSPAPRIEHIPLTRDFQPLNISPPTARYNENSWHIHSVHWYLYGQTIPGSSHDIL
jgi:hypothetical protein